MKMTIEKAVSCILGEKLAQDIISDMGIHWGIYTAMTKATTCPEHEMAVETIRNYNKGEKK